MKESAWTIAKYPPRVAISLKCIEINKFSHSQDFDVI